MCTHSEQFGMSCWQESGLGSTSHLSRSSGRWAWGWSRAWPTWRPARRSRMCWWPAGSTMQITGLASLTLAPSWTGYQRRDWRALPHTPFNCLGLQSQSSKPNIFHCSYCMHLLFIFVILDKMLSILQSVINNTYLIILESLMFQCCIISILSNKYLFSKYTFILEFLTVFIN